MANKNPKGYDRLPKYYRKGLEEKLAKIETKRKRAKIKNKTLTCIILVFGLLFFYFSFFTKNPDLQLVFGVLFASSFFFSLFIFDGEFWFNLLKTVRPTILSAYPELQYSKTKFIGLTNFMSSGLYQSETHGYTGEDLFEGILDEMPFKFSQIALNQKIDTLKLNQLSEWIPLQGLFFRIELPFVVGDQLLVLSKPANENFEPLHRSDVLEKRFSEQYICLTEYDNKKQYLIGKKFVEATFLASYLFQKDLRISIVGGYFNLFIESKFNYFDLLHSKKTDQKKLEDILTQIENCLAVVNAFTKALKPKSSK